MAPALGFALFTLGAPLGLVNAALGVGIAGSLLSTVAPLALSIGAGLLLQPDIPKPKPSDGQVEIRQTVPARVWHYGRVKVSGPLVFYDSRDATLYKAVLISTRQIDAFEQIYLNDTAMTIDGSGWVQTEPYENGSNPLVRIATHLGTEDQAADAYLTGAFPGEWTADHRLRGTAYIVAYFVSGHGDEFQSHYPSGEPQVSALVRGVRMYDPRDGVTRWSDNAGLAILDYLTHPDGYDIPVGEIDLPSFAAFANLCDEPVALAAGGTEPRYRIATTVSLAQPKWEVLSRLRQACDATIFDTPEGKKAIRGGKWQEPTVTIDTEDGNVLEFNFEPPDAFSRYNQLSIQYMEPALGYVEADGTPWRDEVDYASSGILVTQPLVLTQVPSHSQARRLAKIQMARDNCDKLAEVLVDIDGIQCFGERLIRFVNAEIDVDQPFWLDGGPELEAFTITRLPLRSANAASYDWTTAEEGTSTSVPPDTSPDLNLSPPELTLSQIDGPAVRADWTPSAALNRSYEVQYRIGAGTTYTPMLVAGTRDSAVTNPVAWDTTYHVRIRMSAGPEAIGPWSADYPIVIPPDPEILP